MFSSATVVAHTILERYSAEADAAARAGRGAEPAHPEQPRARTRAPAPAAQRSTFFIRLPLTRPVVSGEAGRYARFAFIHPPFIFPNSTIFFATASYCPMLMYLRSLARRTITCR